MKINEKINELKSKIANAIHSNNENLDSLEIKFLNADELLDVGFIHKNVDSLLNKPELNNEDFENFFDINCSQLSPDIFVTPIQIFAEKMTPDAFILEFKKEIVKSYLLSDLYTYISDLKNGNQNLFNNSIK